MIRESENFYYDYDQHRYILTPTGVKNLRGIDMLVEGELANSDDAKAILQKISRNIYTYLYTLAPGVVGNTKYRTRKFIIEYWIYRDSIDEVDTLIDAMLDQVEYTLQSGGDLMTNEYQVNDQLLTTTDKISLWISPTAKFLLKQNPIGFPGRLSFTIPEEEFRDEY